MSGDPFFTNIHFCKGKGREEGRKEGRKGGREEGRKEGREEGRKEGREEGRKGGREEAPIWITQRSILVLTQGSY